VEVSSFTTSGSVRRKNLQRPDQARDLGHASGVVVDIGSLTVGRAVLEPGWKWSADIRPLVGGTSCRIHHLHVLMSGRFAVLMDNGEQVEFEPDDVMDVPPGHDAWVIGHEPAVLLDISGNSRDFGLPTSPARAVVTMLMTDIVGSTATAAQLGDEGWKQRLAEHNRVVRQQLDRFRGREIDTTGDGFLAVFESAGAAVQCALATRDAVRAIGVEIRAGVHTGEVELRANDIQGIAVHAVARIMSRAAASEVLASGVVHALVGESGVQFFDRGRHELKGLPSALELFAVEHA
jgi:class 3 adenylate cyclase